VSVERTSPGQFIAVNVRGGRLPIGRGDGAEFTPTELLLAAIGSCTAIDVDVLTSRRDEPDSFDVAVDANKIRDEDGNRLTDIVVTFRVRFPEGAAGDAARAVLPEAVKRSHDRLCVVGRTVERSTPIVTRLV
jgi:uncharacterized OsmC-like protein